MKILNLLKKRKKYIPIKRTLKTKILNQITNLKFAISLLLLIAFFSSLGTVIEQNKDLNFYKIAYPETVKFFNWKVIYYLQLDKIYQAWWYILLIILLASSLVTCTIRGQYPALKVAQKYFFYTSTQKLRKLPLYRQVPKRAFSFILSHLTSSNYYLFYKKKNIYAYNGFLGKIAPVAIHFSLLFILLGVGISSSTGYLAQEMVVKGELFHIHNLNRFGSLSYFPQTLIGRVNNFWITYKQNNIEQFFSSISILDENYNTEKTEVIFVNKPLKHSDFTLYQTDWNIVGIRLLLDNKFYIQIPLKLVITDNKQMLWSGALATEKQKLISFVIQDLQSEQNIWIYNPSGLFLGKTQINSSLMLDKHKIQILDVISATGLQIKQDSGITLVYSGFLLLMISILVNNISFIQIWMSQTKSCIHIAAKTTKGSIKIEVKLLKILQNFHLRQMS